MKKQQKILIPPETLKNIRDNFVYELRKTESGEKTSLSFIKNPLPQKSLIKDNELFQVLGIGGSVYENALVKKTGRDTEIIQHTRGNVPLFRTREDFLFFVAGQIDHNILVVAINFAQPLKPLIRDGRLDGELIGVSKEHVFAGLLHKLIGKEVELYIALTQKRNILISVANDSVCLALSGLGKVAWNQLAAGIVGTGTTFCFFENPNTVVALESGNFDAFTLSQTGKKIDNISVVPGKMHFEKEVAGAYLYQHFNILMSDKHTPLSSTEELDKAARKSGEETFVARQLFERSAALAACQIVGIFEFRKQPKMTFVMQGSLFWKGWEYEEKVSEYVEKLGVPKGAIRFVNIENSAVMGAAFLVT